MSFEDVQTGCVIRYPYLWHREHERGEAGGRKPRPTAVGVRLVRKEGSDALILFPLTTTEPTADREAVEVPLIEKLRAGLDRDARVWLILDEYNYDLVGESYYLEPVPPLGTFSKAFFGPLMLEVSKSLGTKRRVMRSSAHERQDIA
ncbi:MAG: hypothetical protein AAB654_20095 [Acidobacteriota bacterium]